LRGKTEDATPGSQQPAEQGTQDPPVEPAPEEPPLAVELATRLDELVEEAPRLELVAAKLDEEVLVELLVAELATCLKNWMRSRKRSRSFGSLRRTSGWCRWQRCHPAGMLVCQHLRPHKRSLRSRLARRCWDLRSKLASLDRC
jgi:hypothetical protein